MKLSLSIGAFAGLASAQSLTSVLTSSNETSTLTSLVQGVPKLLDTLSAAKGITILAPNNAAFAAFTSANSAAIAADPGLVAATLEYHVLNGTVMAADILNAGKPLFPHTLLTNESYEDVTGGQYVEAMGSNGNVTLVSGLGMNSSVVMADIKFDGGVIHIIDTVLTIPQNISTTATADGLTSLAGALTSAGLLSTVESLANITVFAPSNAAFSAISSTLAGASNSTLTSVLTYHVINGSVIFSTDLTDGAQVPTLNGGSVTIHQVGSNFFVNGALITNPNNLVENGVVHVIDEVLNPANASAAPAMGATAGSVQFGGMSNSTSSSGGMGNSTASATGYNSPSMTASASGSGSMSASGSSTSSPAMSTGGAACANVAPVLGAVAMGAAFLL